MTKPENGEGPGSGSGASGLMDVRQEVQTQNTPGEYEPLVEVSKLYAELGIATFPIHSGAKVPPRGSHGHHDATLDPGEFRKLLERFEPWHQVGLAARMGDQLAENPGGLLPWGGYAVCLDVDEKNGKSGSATLARCGLELPATLTAETRSGGRHHIYAWLKPLRSTSGLIHADSGLDVKGAGGWIAVFPTSGYRWLDEPDRARIAVAPEWMVNYAGEAKQRRPKPLPDGSTRQLVPCWAHQDANPSLQITTLPDGQYLFHCFAGCSYEDILRHAPEPYALPKWGGA